MKTFLLVIGFGALAGLGGWWLGTQSHQHAQSTDGASGSERKIAFYQSPMHPWVKSDEPGQCTVCGMDLVPVYEGGQGLENTSPDLVMLPEGSPTATNVRTVEVKRQPLTRTLKVAGTIEDDDTRHRIISAYSGGRIEKLYVNFAGDEVTKGQPIASFFSKELLTAALEYKGILESPTTTPRTTEAAEARLLKLGLSMEQIRGIPDRDPRNISFDILAPMTGTVVLKNVYEGQYVEEGDTLFEIADFTIMWFQFIAYEQDLPFLREGLPVTVRTPSLPGREFKSEIKFINPNLDAATRSALVRVEITNPKSEQGLHLEHEMLHRLYATAEVHLEAPEAVTVPRPAVLWSGDRPRVYVEQEPGAYSQRQVVLGRAGDDAWEVISGLEPGEKVVASGNMLIDSQAQLNNLAAAPAPEPSAPVDPAEMADPEAVRAHLENLARLSEALATDDLEAYKHGLHEIAEDRRPETTPANLEDARLQFHQLIQQAAPVATLFAQQDPTLKIYQCPMSSDAAEGLPDGAQWFQFTGGIRNPYMGPKMLACGAEVK